MIEEVFSVCFTGIWVQVHPWLFFGFIGWLFQETTETEAGKKGLGFRKHHQSSGKWFEELVGNFKPHVILVLASCGLHPQVEVDWCVKFRLVIYNFCDLSCLKILCLIVLIVDFLGISLCINQPPASLVSPRIR